MLRSLTINNYILIENLEFIPDEKLTVISGETGTGKSMLLGALGLVLGKRADAKTLFDHDRKCTIEAIFDLPGKKFEVFFLEKDLDYDRECIIRREILPSGKSRAFINDTPVTLDLLKSLGQNLVDIHSQHDILRVNEEDFQIGILDILSKNNDALETYRDGYYKLGELKSKLNRLKEELSRAESEYDYNKFQLDELKSLEIRSGEEDELESSLKKAENIESVKNSLSRAIQFFQNPEVSIYDLLYELKSSIEVSSEYSQNFKNISERLNSILIELKDIEGSLEGENENLETDPQKLHELRQRFDELQRLMKKHKVDNSEELLQIESLLAKKAGIRETGDEEILELEKRIQEQENDCVEIASAISQGRKEAARDLEVDLKPFLAALGMPSGVLMVKIQTTELNPYGSDSITFLFSANKGQEPQPVKEIASGGEMSRLMLVFKYLVGGKSQFPTMIFDEIDVGVSGEIALQMGKMISEISNRHQIICITHLPQVAAKGEKHFKVLKREDETRTITSILELPEMDRIEEIAEMIGGKDRSDHILNSAKELLNKKS